MKRDHCRDCKHWRQRGKGAAGKCAVWEPRVFKNGSLSYNYYEASHYACKKKFEAKMEDVEE